MNERERQMIEQIKVMADKFVELGLGEMDRVIHIEGNRSRVYLEGNIFPGEYEKYRITTNYKITEFPLAVLQEIPIILTKTLQIQIDPHDHPQFWAWTAEVVHNLEQEIGLFKCEVAQQFWLLINLNLSGLMRPPMNKDIQFLNMLTQKLVGHHVSEVIMHKHILSANLSFPLLEGIIRRKCSKYVLADGTVIRGFCAGGSSYSPSKGRSRISNLGHELHLLENTANQNLKRAMNSFGNEVKKFDSSNNPDAYEVIYQWRNETLHGQEFWSTKHGVITNLICLILFHEIQDELYSSKLEGIKRHVEWNQSIGDYWSTRPPWSFYPP